jgi:DNA helicase-2/ATP-dependent DNA helicase PcrA
LLDELNPQQREAAEAVEGPVLIFAGAGSGKTRALTYRIAHMVRDCKIPPGTILAVTFTNKAAGEMKERIQKLIGSSARGVWAGTFHSTCARMLRENGAAIGIPENYVIYDEADQRALVKQVLAVLDIDSKQYKPVDILYAISAAKNELMGPQQYSRTSKGPFDDVVRRVYSRYQALLRDNNALDFDDLLMRTVQLLQDHPEVLEKYQERFHYILVDEYQDINIAQYKFVNMLAARRQNICVVGDDDQAIYGWRGANVGLILAFEKDYPTARTVKLEQNYRSTQKILECAYEVIKHNKGRRAKKLWTTNRPGDNLLLYQAVSAEEEAEWVAEAIKTQVSCGLARPGDYAILYRTNAMSRVFEEAFMRLQIPYEIVGGIRFYERAVIKDFIAYLRAVYNPADAVAMQRIINVPTRGIGDKTVAAIHIMAVNNGCSMYEAVRYCAVDVNLSDRARHAVAGFYDLMESLQRKAATLPLTDFCRAVAEDSGYLRSLEESGNADDAAKAENVREFVSLAQRFQETAEEPTLGRFLEHLALISDLDEAQDFGSKVALMTLHAAKGLEFPIVFMVGMEENIFPHQRSMGNDHELEEERRLCYVGITRAQQVLYMTHAFRRTIYGQPQYQKPSRFLADLPEHLVDRQAQLTDQMQASLLGDKEELGERDYGGHKIDLTDIMSRIRRNGEKAKQRTEEEAKKAKERSRPAPPAKAAETESVVQEEKPRRKRNSTSPTSQSGQTGSAVEFQPGDHVQHPSFGGGTVVAVSGKGQEAILTVAFPRQGVKQLMVAYAPVQKV